ncbi:hypothetical protein, partial [Serratia fonticola]
DQVWEAICDTVWIINGQPEIAAPLTPNPLSKKERGLIRRCDQVWEAICDTVWIINGQPEIAAPLTPILSQKRRGS